MKILFLLLPAVVLLSCNDSSDSSVQVQDSTSSQEKADNVSGCFRAVTGRDTVLLNIQQSGSLVKGTLKFDNYQKDSSHGTVEGKSDGDMITLWYDFFSEGMHSVMEIVLKKKGDDLLRATGPIITKGDTALFQDHQQLGFDEKLILKKISCNEE